MCNTQTYYSRTKCLRLTHTCHTTHKGGTDSTDGGKPPLVVSFSLCVWCGTCVLGSGTLYLNNMSVYCTYIHTTYDFCMDNCQLWLKNKISESILVDKNEFWLIIRLTKVRPSVRKTKRIENLKIADLHTQKSVCYHKSCLLQINPF